MSRDIVLGVLALALGGSMIWLAGWMPDSHGDKRTLEATLSGRFMELRFWRRLWVRLLPAASALAALTGWALQEPHETDELLRPLVVVVILPVCLIWLRMTARAVIALRRPRAMPPLATVGLLRPRIAINDDLRHHLDERALVAAVAHERAHVSHRDPLRIWLAQIVTDAQWPSPSAPRRFQRWLAALEIARDEEARLAGTAGEDLAAAIVAVAGLNRSAIGSAPAQAGLTGAEVDLKHRIRRLLRPLPADPGAPSAAVTISGLILTTLVLAALAGLQFGDLLLRALPFITTT
jgi:BlaR1 peptidase M56